MEDNTDPFTRLARALDQTGGIIARVRPAQGSFPTPCRSWDVRALVNHVVRDVLFFTARVSGETWEEPAADLLGDDWAGAYRTAAEVLLAAWRRPGVREGTIRLPFGEVPATWSMEQQAADLVVHGWDIARATGQPTDLDPELGQAALAWARQNLRPEFRGDAASGMAFGAEVIVPADAPLYDRLAAFFGRDPG